MWGKSSAWPNVSSAAGRAEGKGKWKGASINMELFQNLTTLNRLWSVAERAALLNPPAEADFVFGSIGLHLSRLGNAGYYCTPVNASTFAGTGGDGVHFSLIHISDKPSDQSPVVMTVLLGIFENVIVGSNLLEFLRLGCLTGYAALQTLGYDRNDFLTGDFIEYRKIYTSHHGWPTSTD
jgi:hypothetical protein